MRHRLMVVLGLAGLAMLGGPAPSGATITPGSLDFGTTDGVVLKTALWSNSTGQDVALMTTIGAKHEDGPFTTYGDACDGDYWLGSDSSSACSIQVKFDASRVHPGRYHSVLRVVRDGPGAGTESIPLTGVATATATPAVRGSSLTPTKFAPRGPDGGRGVAVLTFDAGYVDIAGWPEHGARIAVSVYRPSGALVRRWWTTAPDPAQVTANTPNASMQPFTQIWDGSDGHGHLVPAGRYLLRTSVYAYGAVDRSKPLGLTVIR